MINLLKKYKKTKIVAIIVVVLVVLYLIFSKGGDLEYSTDTAKVGVIRQVISETGVVQASEDVTLSFARSGRISGMYFEKGDTVQKGQVIAKLDTGSLNAQLQQAEASLERALVDNTVERAEVSFDSAKQDLVNSLKDTYINADDAVRNKADQAFEDDGSDSPDLVRGGSSYDERRDINSARRDLKYLFNDWEDSLETLNINSYFDTYIKTANTNLLIIRDYLNELAVLVNKFKPNGYDVTSTDIDTYQAAVYSARSIINTTISTLSTDVDSYNSEKIYFNQDDGTGELATLQNIKIKEARAQINSINAQISDAIIISPISGIVSNVMYDNGESVSATAPVVSVISNSNFEISVNVPEDDIENINVGDVAEVEFDAYDSVIFEAEIVFVSGSADLVDGVPVFETILEFKNQDERIRSGLSVDIDVVADQKEDVVIISTRAVVDGADGQFVRLVDNEEADSYLEVPVVLGTRGEDGVIEVIEGIIPGDILITFIEDKVLEKLNKK